MTRLASPAHTPLACGTRLKALERCGETEGEGTPERLGTSSGSWSRRTKSPSRWEPPIPNSRRSGPNALRPPDARPDRRRGLVEQQRPPSPRSAMAAGEEGVLRGMKRRLYERHRG